jgi:hypothetical protein
VLNEEDAASVNPRPRSAGDGQSGRVHPERRGQVGAKAKPPTGPRIPFFPQRERRVNLELVETRTFSSRVVFLRYRVAR